MRSCAGSVRLSSAFVAIPTWHASVHTPALDGIAGESSKMQIAEGNAGSEVHTSVVATLMSKYLAKKRANTEESFALMLTPHVLRLLIPNPKP